MQMQELWQNGSSGPEKAVRICSFLLLAQVLVPVLSLMDSYTGEVPAWLGKQVTYVWNLKDRKDMEKQEAWKVSALEEVSAGLPDILAQKGVQRSWQNGLRPEMRA